jgi:N-acetylglucosaminyldiphosphoundecaprenol N-acetyl-beta-D-mannosaminyltransferase
MEKELARPAERINILGVGIHAVDIQVSASMIKSVIEEGDKGYVCLTGVHGIMEAQGNFDLRSIFARAILVAPDGMPTVWIGRLKGHPMTRRVFGPDLMVYILGLEEFRACGHFFCGGAPGVADRLRDEMLRRFPETKILGTYSPPFRQMTDVEENEFVTNVRALRPDIIWVGLSTPKQEKFMARYLPMLDTSVMIGVGAAFLFHTGAISDSPDWVKNLSLQWLHRLLQEPTRLWRRYLSNNPSFVFHFTLQLIGWKRHPLP